MELFPVFIALGSGGTHLLVVA